MTSYIYFIQAQGDGPIKIGFTADDPRKRMVKIQSDCPWPVELIGAIEGTVAQEKQIHLVLSRWRTQGEWFLPNKIVMAAIQEAISLGKSLIVSKKERHPKHDHPLCIYRHDHGLTLSQAADQLGITIGSLSRIETGRGKPSVDMARKIYERFGIPPRLLRPDMYAIIFPERVAAK